MSSDSILYVKPYDELPILAISRIFSFLSQNDRLNASLVCRSWATAFETPSIWSSIIARFKGEPSQSSLFETVLSPKIVLKNEKAIIFAGKHAKYMRHLELSFFPCNRSRSTYVQKMISTFLSKLIENECNLKRLILWGFLGRYEWRMLARQDFLCSWINFFQLQKDLESVELDIYQMMEIVQMLGSIVAGSGPVITSLIFTFDDTQDSLSQMKKAYHNIFCELPNLQYLELPYEGMNSSVLKNLIEHCPNLKAIQLHSHTAISSKPLPWHFGIPSHKWKYYSAKNPKLEVRWTGELPSDYSFIPLLLPPLMPLTALEFQLDEEPPQSDWNLERVFKYIQNIFAETLVSLKYVDSIGYANVDVSQYIAPLLLSCRNLKDLSVHIRKETPISFIMEICELQRAKRIDIGKLHIDYFSKDSEDEQRLSNIFEDYKDDIGSRDWNFKFQNVINWYLESF